MVKETCEQNIYEIEERFRVFVKNLKTNTLALLRKKIEKLTIIYDRHWHEMMLDRQLFVDEEKIDYNELEKLNEFYESKKATIINTIIMRVQSTLSKIL